MDFYKLLKYAKTDRQREIVQVRSECENNVDAAKKLGISEVNVRACINRINGYIDGDTA